MAASTSTATTTVSSATASAATFPLWTCFVHHERAAKKVSAVESGNHLFSFRIVAHFGKTEAARLARKTIAKQRQRIRLHAHFRKQRLHLLFRSLEREIAHVQFLHGVAPCPRSTEGDAMRG